MLKKLMKLSLVVTFLASLQACVTDPVTGKSTFAMSEEWEINAGKQYHQQIMKQYQEYDNPELQAYVDDIGQTLAKKSHRPNLPFTFTLLDSPEVNAFALPGGFVYITRGIMAFMNKESHLAGVIGHEIGHVTGLHGAERARQQQLATGATIGVAILTGSSDALQASQILGGALMSGYGRKQELESDGLGAEYIARANYDPKDMIDVIGILKNQELFAREKAQAEGRQYQGYHGLFSTHPRNDTRLQNVITAAEKFRDTSSPEPDDGRFLQLTNGMAYGESESQGITRDNKFYHKGLDLYVEFPQGWRVQNTPSVLGALSPDGSKIVQMQIDAIAPPVDGPRYLSSKFSNFRGAKTLSTSEDLAVSGVATQQDQRTGQRLDYLVGMVARGNQAFVLRGLGRTAQPTQEFFNVAQSIRRLKPSEQSLAEGRNIKLVRAKAGDTVSSLAARSNLSSYAEAQIRLINNLYPSGEPKPGQLLKIIE